jgi:hypothetical protein
MTFCVAVARGQQFERSRIPCKRPVSSGRRYDRFAAGPVSVRRDADAQADCAHEKGLQTQAFSEAAEGIRTLDLLHGKQRRPKRPWTTHHDGTRLQPRIAGDPGPPFRIGIGILPGTFGPLPGQGEGRDLNHAPQQVAGWLTVRKTGFVGWKGSGGLGGQYRAGFGGFDARFGALDAEIGHRGISIGPRDG